MKVHKSEAKATEKELRATCHGGGSESMAGGYASMCQTKGKRMESNHPGSGAFGLGGPEEHLIEGQEGPSPKVRATAALASGSHEELHA